MASGSPEELENGRASSTETDTLHRSSLPAQAKSDRPRFKTDVWEQLLRVCPLELLDRLIRNHLSYTESMWPILHCPTFLRHYLDVKKTIIPCTAEFGGLLMALCAISSRSIDDPSVLEDPTDSKTAGLRYFKFGKILLHDKRSDLHCIQVRKRLSSLFHPLITVFPVQALFYLAMFAEGLGKASVHASLVGQAIALAFA
jgi:hypothetical protein